MSGLRRFHGARVIRLIVTVPADLVQAVDLLLRAQPKHPANGNRAEYVRLAVSEKLAQDLMILARCETSKGVDMQGESYDRT